MLAGSITPYIFTRQGTYPVAEFTDETMDRSEFVEPDEEYIENVITVTVTTRMLLSEFRNSRKKPNATIQDVLAECDEWSQDMPNNYESVIQGIEMGTTKFTNVELKVTNEDKQPTKDTPIPGL